MGKSTRKWLLLLVGLSVCLVAVGTVVVAPRLLPPPLRIWDIPMASLAYEEAKARAREAGVPFSVEEHSAQPSVDPDLNAALRYESILAQQRPQLQAARRAMREALRDPQRGAREALNIAAPLEGVATAITQASRLPYYNSNRLVSLELTDFAEYADILWFFVLRADALAHVGQVGPAAQDLATARRIAKHLSYEPFFEGLRAAFMADQLALEGTRVAAATLSRNPAGLSTLENVVLASGPLQLDLRSAMRSEAFLAVTLAERVATPPLEGTNPFVPHPKADHLIRVHQLVHRNPMFRNMAFRGMKAEMLEGWTLYLESIPESGATFEHFLEADRSHDAFLRDERTSSVLSVLLQPTHVAELGFRPSFEHLGTRAFLRVLQYRNQHGRWPISLEEAGAEAVADYPRQPLQYRRDGDGFFIVSTGSGHWHMAIPELDDGADRVADFLTAYPPE